MTKHHSKKGPSKIDFGDFNAEAKEFDTVQEMPEAIKKFMDATSKNYSGVVSGNQSGKGFTMFWGKMKGMPSGIAPINLPRNRAMLKQVGALCASLIAFCDKNGYPDVAPQDLPNKEPKKKEAKRILNQGIGLT
jgi:hypothetical protein